MKLATRILKNTKHNQETDCLEWQKYKNTSGYGTIKVDGQMLLAHRVAYSFFIGPIPQGMCVLHSCDNPKCVNPKHLWLGTNYDNVQDKVKKGRAGAKLKPKDIPIIKTSTLSAKQLGTYFGVSAEQIRNVRSGKSWGYYGD